MADRTPQKRSPFLLTDECLTRLTETAHDPAVQDLVGWYRRAANDAAVFAEMLTEEMTHFGVAP